MHETALIRILQDAGIDLLATLPCDRTKTLSALLPRHFDEVRLLREEDGVGVAAGAFLGGRRPAIAIQSSGLGNMMNALLSLSRTYGLPLPIITSWRGVYREAIPAQVPFNRAIPAMLEAFGIPYERVLEPVDLPRVARVVETAYAEETPAVALVSPRVWEGGDKMFPATAEPVRADPISSPASPPRRAPTMTRFEAIRAVSTTLGDALAVSNIGVPGKELYALCDRPGNFYMLGSYTQATPIGLGLAIAANHDVVVIDGDGSLLGTAILPVIAARHPPNLTIVGCDNGVFGSTGNQPTGAAPSTDLALLAVGAGMRDVVTVDTPSALTTALLAPQQRPRFILARCRPGNADLPNIPLTPTAIRDRFMRYVESASREKARTPGSREILADERAVLRYSRSERSAVRFG